MAEISDTVELRAPASEVWAMVGDFSAFAEWHPVGTAVTVEKRGDATVRTVTIAGGDRLTEKLGSIDADAMTLSYSLVEGPLPVENMDSTMTVAPLDDQSTVTWRMNFEPKRGEAANARAVVEELVTSGLEGLRKKFG